MRSLSTLNNPVKMWLFLLLKLPAAWFMGVRVRQVTPQQSDVTLPYGWRSQNPFRSTYFAAQMAAGEMATGLLCLAAIGQRNVSMLVLRAEANFYIKADRMLTFTCTDAALVNEATEGTLADKQPRICRMKAVGQLPDGRVACEVFIEWSLRAR